MEPTNQAQPTETSAIGHHESDVERQRFRSSIMIIVSEGIGGRDPLAPPRYQFASKITARSGLSGSMRELDPI